MAEYHKRTIARIIRTEHKVLLWVGSSAANLRQALAPVPINARITDIEDVDEGGNRIALVFTDEAPDEREPQRESLEK